jgi:hypothetical protein
LTWMRLRMQGADWGLPARCQVTEWGTRNTSWDWPLRLHQLRLLPRFSGTVCSCFNQPSGIAIV